MAGPTPIQIQRTMNFGTPNTTQTAANGQLCYSGNSQVLFINFGGTIYPIAGFRNPGTLTANQALVANSTSGINNIITANLAVSAGITANGALGTLNQVLTSNSTGGVYWSSPGAASVNTQAQYTWTNTHTFQSNVTITGNSTAELLTGVPFQAAALGGSVANQTGFYLGNSTVNSAWTYASLVLGSTTVGNATITEGTLGAAAAVGGVQINTTAVALGNSTVNSTWSYASLVLGSTTVGNASVQSGTLGAAAAVGGSQMNTTVIAVGNSTVNASINSTAFTGQSATVANGGVTVGNNQLVSNSTGLWIDQTKIDHNSLSNFVANKHIDHSTVTLTAGNGLTGGGDITASRSFAVIANSGLTANATGVFIAANNGLSVNTTGLYVVAGNGIISNTTGVYANVGSGITIASGAIAVNSVLSITDLTLSGNLTVQGTTTTLDTTTLQVKDNMIVLADQLATTGTFLDNVDAGWYVKTGNTSVNFYTGMGRVAASSTNTNPVFKLFATGTLPNNTIIDTTANTGTLIAYLNSGALTSNATNVAITATGSFGVNIVANTLSLSTALPGTSGGTGKPTVANNSLLYGNSTNGYNELTLGTTGYVLQSTGSAIVYDVIDGGTFAPEWRG